LPDFGGPQNRLEITKDTGVMVNLLRIVQFNEQFSGPAV
jgi:hypothetical protein